jgi:hypothetical protein
VRTISVSLIALILASCGPEREQEVAKRSSTAQPPSPPQVSQAMTVVPMPKDQAQLDRLILAGFTPHNDHLHRPGVTSCPLSKGSDVVM